MSRLVRDRAAARYLGISLSLLHKEKAKGRIEFVRISKRAVRYDLAALDKYIEERRERVQTSQKPVEADGYSKKPTKLRNSRINGA